MLKIIMNMKFLRHILLFVFVILCNVLSERSVNAKTDIVNTYVFAAPIQYSMPYAFAALPNVQLKVSPKTLTFDTASPGAFEDMCVVVTNVGTEGPLTFSAPTITGPGASAYSVPTLPSPLGPGESASYCIRYSPPSTGTFPAVVTINSNGRDSGAQSVTVGGQSVNPLIEVTPLGNNTATKLFRGARVRIGDTLEQRFLVRNIGGGKLALSASSFIDGPYFHYYLISRLPADGIANGKYDTVALKFLPRHEGSALAQLHLVHNASTDPYLMNLVGIGILPHIEILPSNSVTFDSVALGDSVCKTISVYNSGSETLTLRKQYFTSSDGDFKVFFLAGADINIPPTQSRDINICFKPLAGGNRVAGIRLLTNIPQTFEAIDGVDDGMNNGVPPEKYIRRDTGYVEIGMSGSGYTQGKLTSYGLVGKPFIDSSLVGVQLCRTESITNFGDGDVTLTSMIIVGAASDDYTIKTVKFPYFLGPNKSVDVEICGKPSVRGPRPVNFSVFGTANDKPVSFSAPIDVKGLIACVRQNPVALFIKSRLYIGQSDTAIETIINCGDNMSTYTAELTGVDYSLLPPTTVSSIAPRDSAQFRVIFMPSSRGNKEGNLKITTPNLLALTIRLLGEGICAVPTATPFIVPAPPTPVRDTSEVSIPIANNGNADWILGASFVSPDSVFSFVASKSDSIIKAGATGKITVSFHPTSLGNYFGLITFPNGGPCQEKTVTINLSGTAEVNAVRDVTPTEGYSLEQNIPNPTSGKTSISYTVPKETNVRVILTDITGNFVRELVNRHVAGGSHEIQVATSDLSSGTYIYIFESGNIRLVRQMIINK